MVIEIKGKKEKEPCACEQIPQAGNERWQAALS